MKKVIDPNIQNSDIALDFPLQYRAFYWRFEK